MALKIQLQNRTDQWMNARPMLPRGFAGGGPCPAAKIHLRVPQASHRHKVMYECRSWSPGWETLWREKKPNLSTFVFWFCTVLIALYTVE